MPDAVSWPAAREVARAAGVRLSARLGVETLPVGACTGRLLGEDVAARSDLPPADASAMDGWAVSGPGPWRAGQRLLAGTPAGVLGPGEAAVVATGTWLPAGAEAVLRREHASLRGGWVHATHEPAAGADVRRQGHEARAGDLLAPAGALVTPALVALACAGGLDALPVRRRPRVALLVLGDELLDDGVAREGKVRDALGPALPAWVRAYGADCTPARRVPDDAGALAASLTGADADLVLTTGGTASGPADHLHRVLDGAGAHLLVDGVAVRPGHPMLLAELADARPLVGLPGNPLAAAAAVLTLLAPLLGAERSRHGRLQGDVPPSAATRLVPVRDGRVCGQSGPAMLRGLAGADAVAVLPPGSDPAVQPVELLVLPW